MLEIEEGFKHIPTEKQKELRKIVSTIHQRVEHLAYPVEMIILFGSYARGQGIEDKYQEGHITYEYQSDFDLLIIVRFKNFNKQNNLEKILRQAIEENEIKTPVSLIVHDIEFVNQALTDSQYFFVDIEKEGVVLYDSKRYVLGKPIPLPPEKRFQFAREDFKYWFKQSYVFYKSSIRNYNEGEYNIAIFELHQCSENLYHTVLLVYTNYKPKCHDLAKLRGLVCGLDCRFANSFPLKTEEDKQYFKKLQKAYIDARYNKDYCITKNEIEEIIKRVKIFLDLVENLCCKKIKEFYILANKDKGKTTYF